MLREQAQPHDLPFLCKYFDYQERSFTYVPINDLPFYVNISITKVSFTYMHNAISTIFSYKQSKMVLRHLISRHGQTSNMSRKFIRHQKCPEVHWASKRYII